MRPARDFLQFHSTTLTHMFLLHYLRQLWQPSWILSQARDPGISLLIGALECHMIPASAAAYAIVAY